MQRVSSTDQVENVTMGDSLKPNNTPLENAQVFTEHPFSRREPSTLQQNPVALSFLSLPAELRNQIYENVFQGRIIAIRPDSRRKDSLETDIWSVNADPYQVLEQRPWPLTNDTSNGLGLLYTCRQIHAETKHMSYGLSTVLCGDRAFPCVWTTNLCSNLVKARRLQLCSYMPANIVLSRVWLEILPRFNDLDFLEIYWQLRVPSWGSEEDHLSTAATDEVDMRKKIINSTSAACEISFHRAVIWE